MRALEILKNKLVVNFMSKIEVGDWWILRFQDHSIIAQSVILKDETLLNTWMAGNYPLYQTTVDKENIAKCAIVASQMRRLVTDIHLDMILRISLRISHIGSNTTRTKQNRHAFAFF